ncbi:MAG: hypothetical protein Q8930_13090 [Bacillota bacterium]|nr:hypothetical protein [Bacillota bacterium]
MGNRRRILTLLYAFIWLVSLIGCAPTKASLSQGLGVKEVKTYKYIYEIPDPSLGPDPIDLKAGTTLVLTSQIAEDTEVEANFMNEKGEGVFKEKTTVGSDHEILFLTEDDAANNELIVNGNYKAVLTVLGKKENIQLDPIGFTVSEGYGSMDEVKTAYQKYLSSKDSIQKVDAAQKAETTKKEADSAAAKQKADDAQLEKEFKNAPVNSYDDLFDNKLSKGRVSGEVLQVLDDTDMLLMLDGNSNKIVKISNVNTSGLRADKWIEKIGVISVGTYNYTTVLGASKEIPNLRYSYDLAHSKWIE